ncbi:MAG: hypothetical protein IH798_00365 [Gemmatimonadetes bacterium]|nr:hypothetical protein [Gemmatimonadota bacterium]
MKQVVWTGVAAVMLLGVAGPASAQGLTFYMPPNCELDTQHFLVRNAELYVKAATEARSDEQRDRSIADAKRVLMDALEAGEETNPGVWYFLGRAYALESDLPGADSAFAKAEALYPGCAEDMDNQRRSLWVPFYNQGAEALTVNDLEAAREAFAQADQISNKEPFVPYYLASVLISQNDIPGALELFKKTVGMGQTEGDYEESYLTSLFNAGRLHHMLEQWDSAAVWYVKYRQVSPDDREALTGLLQVLESGGHDEEALAFTDTILAHADAMTDVGLFTTGVSLFQANRYETAVQAFRAGLEKNRHYRDGVFNLAQAYFAIANPGDGTETPTEQEQETRDEAAKEMLDVAKRLQEIDPASESSMRLLAAAYQLNRDTTATLAMLERIEALTFDVRIELFQPSDSGYQVQGTIANPKEEETRVPDLVFEFVDVDGRVVTTETVFGRTLTSKATDRFQLSPVGEGIAAWRYYKTES